MHYFPSLLTPLLFMFLVVGCSECSLDSCDYNPEKIAVWSETDNSLAVIIEDLGEKDEQKDNHNYLYTLDLDGSRFEKSLELNDEQYILYFNETNQYVVVGDTPNQKTYNKHWGVGDRYELLDLTNGNNTVLADVNNEPCLGYRVIPSIDGNHIARITIQGQQNGILQFSETSGNITVTSPFYYEENLESNIGCSKLILEVEFIDVVTGAVITKVTSTDPGLKYQVYEGYVISVYLEALWGQAGLIIQNFDLSNINSEYSLITADGVVSAYSKPEDCGQYVTSSGVYSQNGAQAIVIGFEGATEAQVAITEDVAEENVVCLP